MIYENPILEILSVHKFKVQRSTAEMICYAFSNKILCNRKINIHLFNRFNKYNPLYVFSYNGNIFDLKDQPIKLHGVEIIVPAGKEEEFMDENSNFIFYGGSNSGIEWLDMDENSNFTGVYGSCRINF